MEGKLMEFLKEPITWKTTVIKSVFLVCFTVCFMSFCLLVWKGCEIENKSWVEGLNVRYKTNLSIIQQDKMNR